MHLFEHFFIWNGNDNYCLGLNSYDNTASTRFILIDATHQHQSRNNYINTLVEYCNSRSCYNALILVNSVSEATLRNIPNDINVNFVDANHTEMKNTDGDSFYQFIEFGDEEYRHHNPPLGYCPQFNHICNVEDFYYGFRNPY
ncbi:hypothetical protein [Providencia sp. VP23HZSY-1]|uniref:hypothetical protein n=1 Tax=Providencia sp. VP23HZSY-1 TaxID=3391806 RepID=UPI003AF8F682